MNRQEALEHFKANVSENLVKEYRLKFEEYFEENEEKVKKLLIDGMKKLIKKAKEFDETEKDYKIGVFQFELLRINILNESYKIFAHGYNSLWYLDKDSIYEEIDLKFLFELFIDLKEKLIKEKKIYMGKVNKYDIQEIIFNLAVECYNDISISIRSWFWNLDEEPWMKENFIETFYTVKWSEYQGKSEILFAMDNRQKDINELLELKKQPEEKHPFVYTVWKDSKLEVGDLTKQNMLFINFKGSRLKEINFSESYIIKGQFKAAKIQHCEFENSKLGGASFENAIIQDSNFRSAECIGVDFSNSELSYVDFTNAKLKKSAFIGAKLKNVSFEGADVEDAVFSEKDIPFIHLTSEQLQTIYIDGGKEE
ncbi:hypothetical protein CLPUN_27930 [Clostridium puniceum]|uniref:Secreted effector protein pipB2 n=1 Tax=Clostridium puniceum TaxID=29367 RepID=A0A1S8TEG5_9CLOT|nr:pentapeptide repeat-containing protein [Clostridium puniceum]OOM76180.1 hypothetical protein CLPUN_27930 [Clostridium puniceum]